MKVDEEKLIKMEIAIGYQVYIYKGKWFSADIYIVPDNAQIFHSHSNSSSI